MVERSGLAEYGRKYMGSTSTACKKEEIDLPEIRDVKLTLTTIHPLNELFENY